MQHDLDHEEIGTGIRLVSEPNAVPQTTIIEPGAAPAKDSRRHSGMFKPGVSCNPSGRPRSDATIKELAKAHTEEAINTLVEVLRDKRAPVSAKVHAACAILTRGWGKPTQYVESAEMPFWEYARQRIADGALEFRTVLDEMKENP